MLKSKLLVIIQFLYTFTNSLIFLIRERRREHNNIDNKKSQVFQKDVLFGIIHKLRNAKRGLRVGLVLSKKSYPVSFIHK